MITITLFALETILLQWSSASSVSQLWASSPASISTKYSKNVRQRKGVRNAAYRIFLSKVTDQIDRIDTILMMRGRPDPAAREIILKDETS